MRESEMGIKLMRGESFRIPGLNGKVRNGSANFEPGIGIFLALAHKVALFGWGNLIWVVRF
jgi:hypothetical protein